MILKGTIAFLCCLVLILIRYFPPSDTLYWEIISQEDEESCHGLKRQLCKIERFWLNWNMFYIRDLYIYGFHYWFGKIDTALLGVIIVLMWYGGFLFYEINC